MWIIEKFKTVSIVTCNYPVYKSYENSISPYNIDIYCQAGSDEKKPDDKLKHSHDVGMI